MRRIFFLLILVAGLYLGYRTFFAQKTANAKGDSSQSAAPTPTPTPVYRIGIQAGHWKVAEAPADEFPRMRIEGTGASVEGINEWEVVLSIADLAATELRKKGIEVDVLPATVPEGYKADAFISIHADGNEDITVGGYKVAGSTWSDELQTQRLVASLDSQYGKITGMASRTEGESISDAMTQYYAFNYNRFRHAIDKNTPGAIIEVGFLTNSKDRNFLIEAPERIANGIVEGVLAFKKIQHDPIPTPTPFIEQEITEEVTPES